MKPRDTAEEAIRFLSRTWVRLEEPKVGARGFDFDAFKSWMILNGYEKYLALAASFGTERQAALWFHDELSG